MNRQRLILFILVIVFGIAALWSYSTVPRLKTVPAAGRATEPRTRPAGATVPTAAQNSDKDARLNTHLLDQVPEPFKGYRRNIFRPLFADETNSVRQRIVRSAPPPPRPLPAPVPAPVQPVAMPLQTAALAHFTFLGFMKNGPVKTIFLTSEKDILLVKKGDHIADRYEATDITDQALTLTTTDTKDQIVIPLIENRALAPAR